MQNRIFQAGRKESLAETIPEISESGWRSNTGAYFNVKFCRVEVFVTGD